MGRLVINGEEVYELDETCLKEKRGQNNQLRDRYRYAEHLEGNQASADRFGNLSYTAADSFNSNRALATAETAAPALQ